MIRDAYFSERLAVVSHVTHYEFEGHLYAYGPYVREIEVWADLFDQILVAAPYRKQTPPSDRARFEHTNLRVIPQREIGGESLRAKLKLAVTTPLMAWDLCKALRQADAIHVRCPGNLGLLGAVLAPLFSKKIVAKFAGQWSPSRNEPWSTRFQRWVLSSRWWRGPVTVYGRWPDQPEHVIPFFSSALTEEQMRRGRKAAASGSPKDLRNILFVGRLSSAKNVDVLLEALSHLRARTIVFAAAIAGEGPESGNLRKLSMALGLSDCVEFTGGVSSDRVTELLENSGILVLASETEGWPKAIVEAMAFGLLVIGSNVGLVPEILGSGRGLTVLPRDVEALTSALQEVLDAPDKYSDMRKRAAEWAREYSLESLRDSLRLLLERHWGTPAKDSNHLHAHSSSVPLSSGVK